MDHPPYLPELNPIENIRGVMREELKNFPQVTFSDQLFEQFQVIRLVIGRDYNLIQNLYSPMPNRL